MVTVMAMVTILKDAPGVMSIIFRAPAASILIIFHGTGCHFVDNIPGWQLQLC